MNDDTTKIDEAAPAEEAPVEEAAPVVEEASTEEVSPEAELAESEAAEAEAEEAQDLTPLDAVSEASTGADLDSEAAAPEEHPGSRWYVVHTYSGHENRVATALKQRVESEHLENKIFDILVPTQDKIEIRSGRKEQIKEKIFPGYLLVKMILDDDTWLAVRTTQGVTSFIGMGSKPTPISEAEVQSIIKFSQQGGTPTYKQAFNEGDTVKIVDGPFTEFIGKVDNVDKERGKVRVLVSIFGRETPVELDFLQVQKL